MRTTEARRILSLIQEHPLGILPSKAEELEAALTSGNLDARTLKALTGSRHDRQISPTSGSVAVIPLFGVLMPRPSFWTRWFGGTDLEGFGARFDDAVANEDVKDVIVYVDSPGGSVHLTPETADRVFRARGKKRIIAVIDGLGASAAYWLACQADQVVLNPSGLAGSIGVFMMHTEFSKMDSDEGITRTIIRAGRHKAEGNAFEPLPSDAAARMQARVDEFYDLFVAHVARARGSDPDEVRNGYGEGAVLSPQQAMTAGLVDRIATLEDVLGELGVHASAIRDARAEDDPAQLDVAATADGLVDLPEADYGERAHAGITYLPTASEDEDAVDEEDLEEDEEEPLEVDDQPTDADGDATDEEASSPNPTAPSGQEDPVKKGTVAPTGAEGGGTLVVGEGDSERQRASQIADVCAALGVPHRAGEFIDSGDSIDDVRETLRADAEAGLKAMQPQVELTDREVKRYSLTRAIMNVADKGDNWDGFEREVSDQIGKNLPKGYESHGGIFVPVKRPPVTSDYAPQRGSYLGRLSAMVSEAKGVPVLARARLLQQIDQMQAALDTGTATAGQELVFTEAGDFIDLLRARMKVAELGATILTGLNGPVAFPKQTGAGTFAWVGEDPGSDVADSDLTLTQVALNPTQGQSSTAYTRQLLAQGIIDVDNLVKMDLSLITALGIDLAGIAGTGAGNQPTGVLNTVGIGDVPIGANGGAPTYAHMVDLETGVATANADIGSMAYLTTPGVRGKLKKTEEFASSNGRPVWTGGMEGEVNGYPGHVSTQVPSNLTKGSGTNLHAVIFGVWSQLMIGYWGAYELVVDPFSKKKQALIELTSFQMAGLAVRHPASFNAVQDADPTA